VITCRLYRNGVLKEEDFDPERAGEHLKDRGSRVWLDVAEPTQEELAFIQRVFDLHPLVVEDIQHRSQRPKLDVYDGYFFLSLHGLSLGSADELVDSEIHAIVNERMLVTIRHAPTFDLSEVVRRWDRQPELTAEGAGFLLYALVDEVVDGYFDIVDRLEDLSEDIEDRVFGEESDPGVQQTIFRLKRQAVTFRRYAGPLRALIDRLLERPQFVTPPLAPYFRDMSDHVIRVLEFSDNIRELLTTSLEAQLSQTSNRLNQTMKQLTSWAAIILVPTLIAGIYGMNFRHIPEFDWAFGYPFALALMAAGAFTLYKVFRRHDWL
jgi:magnesium transporter